MLSYDDICKTLESKGGELSEWLKNNFNPHTAIIITDTEVKIVETLSCVPTSKN